MILLFIWDQEFSDAECPGQSVKPMGWAKDIVSLGRIILPEQKSKSAVELQYEHIYPAKINLQI